MPKQNKSRNMIRAVVFYIVVSALILASYYMGAYAEDKPPEKKEISVILYYAGPGGWDSLQEGVKRAATDFNANVNYVILKEGADAEEEYATILKEAGRGLDGLIIAASDSDKLQELWKDDLQIPVVAVESGCGEIPLVTADNYEMGRMLGEELLRDFAGKEPRVALTTETATRDSLKLREQGLRDALEGRAQILSWRAAANGEGADAAVALDKEKTVELLGLEAAPLKRCKYYCIGNTAATVAALDLGDVDKLIFQNEFNMGYLAVEELLHRSGAGDHGEEEVDYYLMDRSKIYEPPYEQLLFPIVE